MMNAIDIATVVGICAIVAFIIGLVLGLLFKERKTPVERPRKASLPPLHGGYKPLPSEGGRGHQETPPKAPKGSGGGSH